MGKLTGPSSQFSDPGAGAKERLKVQNAKKDKGSRAAPASGSPKSKDSYVAETDSAKRRSKRGGKNPEFTGSMIEVVNNAAETARLVLDQAEAVAAADDNKSVSSHGSRRSVGSANSIHSYNSFSSRKSSGCTNGIATGDQPYRTTFSTDEAAMINVGNNCAVDDGTGIEDLPSRESSFMRSETSCEMKTTPFTPPPTAFQNLPMTRGFSSLHKSANSDDVLSQGKIFEVTNHFDAAAAISAALASSHLAQASGSLGELERPHPYPSIRRRSSVGEESLTRSLTISKPAAGCALRRSHSGDALSAIAKVVDEPIVMSYTPIKKQQVEKEDDSPPYRRSLPTPEEAEAEMLLNRTSFVSMDDLSLGSSDTRKMKQVMEAFSLSGIQPSTPAGKKEEANGDNANNNDASIVSKLLMKQGTEKKGSPQCRRPEEHHPTREVAEVALVSNRTFVAEDEEQIKKQNGQVHKSEKEGSKHDGTLVSDSAQKKELEGIEDRLTEKDVQSTAKEESTVTLKSDDSASNCSSSGYENESNTSSVYGSNTNSGYSSDISPMSISTGGTGEKQNVVNKKGMLGNLASSRRSNLSNLQESNHSYDGADDEYSTQSENSGGINVGTKQHLPIRRRQEGTKSKSAVSKTVTFSSNSAAVVQPMCARTLIGPSRKTQKILFDGSGSVRTNESNDYVAPPVAKESHGAAPTHHMSLFDSFDRNWEQAILCSECPDMLNLGRKCLASFSIIFGSCNNASGRSIFLGDIANDNSSKVGEEKSLFRWWVDENALTSVSDIMHRGSRSAAMDQAAAGGKEENDFVGIPIVVIHTLWKSCFFDKDLDGPELDADVIIDLIQHTLVKDLCYLTESQSPSAPCLRLSLDVYAEYGRYILRRFAMLDQITQWHMKFSLVLRKILHDDSLADADTIVLRRYAAQSLPRHTAIGFCAVDSDGNLHLDVERGVEFRTHLFNLLCDESFIKSRAALLGRGNTQHGDLDERLKAGGANPQIAKLIKQTRDGDRNLLFSTMAHMKDMEWCSLFCIEEDVNKKDKIAEGAPSFSDCLNAMTLWKKELINNFRSLHGSGKLAICDNAVRVPKVSPQLKDEELIAADQLAQLVSYCNEDDDVETTGEGGSFLKAAKSLLAADDAWTMKDDSAHIFKGGPIAKDFTTPRPPRKGRRKRAADQKGGLASTTSLARILNININDLRTAVSIGRSLISLAEFSQYMGEREVFLKELKESRSAISQVHRLQSLCLTHAIEVLSCSAITLGYILSSALDKLDEDDLDETVTTRRWELFGMTREAAKPLLSVSAILSADAWFSLGKLVSNACKSDEGRFHVMLFSFERALLILNSPRSTSLNKPALDLLCESLLSPLTQYKCFLQSSINHSIGVYTYEQGDFDRAAEYLDKSSRFRRQMLDDLRGHPESDDKSNGLSKLFSAVVGGMKSNLYQSPPSMSEDLFTNIFEYSVCHGCIQLSRETFALEELELSLSLTLEYSALTQHACQKYQQALSFFQESLILRTMHVGKHSLDVASLHFNMGVVYDDLEQYDQAISRYHESLRIRLDHMNKATSPKLISELDDSVLLTLKCLGQVYKIVNDLDNAVCCYVKALEMVNKKFSSYREATDEWSKMGLRLGLAVPVPTVIFEEMKVTNGNSSWKTHFQMMNKKELCHVFDPRHSKRRSRSTVSKLKKELSKIHSAVIDLVHERKQNSWDNDSGSSRVKCASSSLLLASLSPSLKTGGDAFEAALMRSSFSMGRMRLEQMRYEEAADYLESALRSKWVLDPASSSDSDSDFSRKSLSSLSKHQPSKTMDEDDPEEGQIYYALGICNAALDDHERAVRCFLTAMRYLRRSLRKVDSLEVARVLFDCATSHYYLCHFDQSVSLYRECLRILESYGISTDDKRGNGAPADADAAKNSLFRRGIVLYCLVLAKAAIDFDSEASNLLNEAQTLLSSSADKIIQSYMEFLTGLFLHHAASQVPLRLRSITKITPNGLSLNDAGPAATSLSWNAMCESSITLLEQVKNECWFDPLEGVEDSDEVKHLPLSGHICFKKGQVYELIDSLDQALNSYVDAANFYRIACGDENMYVASVLHRMGMICARRNEYAAIGYFNEALSIRKNILGNNDRLVADTLYSSAVILARLNRYEASMERYHEALRIHMADSQDSNEVARTLAGMGICHYSHRAFDLSLTCLEGAVKIRKYRVSRLTDSAELVSLYGEEVALGADFFNLGNAKMQIGEYEAAMQCFIQSRDLRWRHVGSGTVDKILDKYFSEITVDEDELLGLAHCLHNIGVMFDIKKEYNRSLPHYEEALAIKNAIAGFTGKDSTTLIEQVNPHENRALVLQSLHKDHDFPQVNKATLSASVTRQKIATVYAKQRKFDHAIFHFSHALRIQRHVLGKDNFRIPTILSSMGNALRRLSRHSDTAILCYNESLRISKLRFGQNHSTVASSLLDIGRLYDSNNNFGKALHYYQRAAAVYKQKYSQNLRQRLCSGLDRSPALMNSGDGNTEILSTGDEIVVAGKSSVPEKQIREQYALVTDALRRAKRQDMISRGEQISCVGDSNDAWLTFEVLFFRFVEMLSTYVVDPAQTAVRHTIDSSRRRIDSAAAHAVISAADAIDYQFLLLLQD